MATSAKIAMIGGGRQEKPWNGQLKTRRICLRSRAVRQGPAEQ